MQSEQGNKTMNNNGSGISVSRRRFMAGLGAGALAAPMITRAAWAQARELNVLFPGGTWQEYFQKALVDPFVAEHSGVNFVWNTGLGFEPLVIAQRRRPQWDIMHQNQNTSAQLGALDAVIEWTEDDLPNLKDIHPSFRYPFLAGKVHTPYAIEGIARDDAESLRKVMREEVYANIDLSSYGR